MQKAMLEIHLFNYDPDELETCVDHHSVLFNRL